LQSIENVLISQREKACMPQATYDAIVLGAGGVGSATMWQLARRGLRVLGLDRFAPPHDRGSSHGQSRIIRQAYFEHPDYVPLLLESYRLWDELEHHTKRGLLLETGLLEVGPADGVVVPGVLRAACAHGLAVESLSASEIRARWPAFQVGDELVGVFEPRGGLLHVEHCVLAQLVAAEAAGAELHVGVEILEWSVDGVDVRVETSAGRFTCRRLVITAGAWAGKLLADLNLHLQVRRKSLLWHATSDPRSRADAGFPCYLFELPTGIFYGFPMIDERGLKVAEHSGGETVDDPLNVDRSLRDADREPVEAFLHQYLPSVEMPCRDHAVCLYTMSPDEHFIVDRHPDYDQVVFAAGLSGHGFKFTPVLGAALADLAATGRTTLPIEFLSARRF
jgi:monomeric sarcosine oxidase